MNPTTRSHFASHAVITAWLAVTLPLLLTGCTMCQNCGDLDYPTYGGAWQRTRRDSGRVGSIFDPAGARTAKLSDRDASATPDSPSLRSPRERIDPLAPVKPSVADKDKKKGSNDPKDESAKADESESSPSDRSKKQNQKAEDDSNKLRDLDLDDIRFQPDGLMPPDV